MLESTMMRSGKATGNSNSGEYTPLRARSSV
jgi:hypothetical protein